jgi:oxygen-independent coproporphyrinogen III oxidase
LAGIYVHIPFCRQACYYCNFHFSTSLQYKNEFLTALLKEAKIQAANNYLQGQTIETIYLGGGTPSLLSLSEINSLISTLHQLFLVSSVAEITLEANPDDVNEAQLAGWKQAGINRLSIGIQSLFDEDLQWMNRVHNARQAKEVIQKSRAAGFDNFTVDLIYGTPGLTDENWNENLDWVIAEQIHHLSCYALTVEPKTALDHLIQKNEKADVDAEQQRRQFIQLMNKMNTAGFEHYEISNFAKPGHRSKHNSSYWHGSHYLGLGPSAHSFNGASRQWNIANNMQYIHSLEKGTLLFEREELTPTQQLNEYIMTSLRLLEGCSLQLVEEQFGTSISTQLQSNAKVFEQNGWLLFKNQHLVLSQEGKLFADKIAGELFFN